jgi:hypothetical protein
MTDDTIKHPLAKGLSTGAIFLVDGMSWSDIAAMLAALYTFCLLTEWAWKRVWKPLAQRLGWIKGKPREFLDSTGSAPLDK